jgi:hypothetical protein
LRQLQSGVSPAALQLAGAINQFGEQLFNYLETNEVHILVHWLIYTAVWQAPRITVPEQPL